LRRQLIERAAGHIVQTIGGDIVSVLRCIEAHWRWSDAASAMQERNESFVIATRARAIVDEREMVA
jgi:hypothetical protein